MKIVVLQGSPNRRGSTWLLADAFRRGAEGAGHTVEVIEVAHADIRPCTGCVRCGYEGICVQKMPLKTSAKRYWVRICSFLPRPCTITG